MNQFNSYSLILILATGERKFATFPTTFMPYTIGLLRNATYNGIPIIGYIQKKSY